MSVTSLSKAAWAAQPFLYQGNLGDFANISVTHNLGVLEEPFSGNLGDHVGDDLTAVKLRRKALESTLGTPIQWLKQVHGTHVFRSDAKPTLEAPIADAVVTTQTGVSLAIMTADCLPVLFTASNDAGLRAIGVAHAGWKGLAAGILQNTVQMLSHMVPNANIHAHLGPCIGMAQFEVGDDVLKAFSHFAPHYAQHFTPKSVTVNGAKYYCDLESLAKSMLASEGVNNLSGGGWCTHSDPRLASYRRSATTGRFASLISLQ